MSLLLQIDPAAWIRERQHVRQEPDQQQPAAATHPKADTGAANTDSTAVQAGAAATPQQSSAIAAVAVQDGGAGLEAGSSPAKGGADGVNAVKVEPPAQPKAEPDAPTNTADAATAAADVVSAPIRPGESGSDVAAAAGGDAGADHQEAVKQEDDSKPQVHANHGVYNHNDVSMLLRS